MINKIFGSILTGLFILALSGCPSPSTLTDPTPPPGPSSVVLSPASKVQAANETYDVTISVSNVSGVMGYAINLTFDPAVVEMLSSSSGGFLGASTTGLFAAYKNGDINSGTIIIGETRTDLDTSSGSGQLCTITFRALTPGTSNLFFFDVNKTSALLLSDGTVSSVDTWVDAN